MFVPRQPATDDALFTEKVSQMLVQLQQPYARVHAKAAQVIEAGIPKLKLIANHPINVLRLAEALHKIPRSMREDRVDELRLHVAEATVALADLEAMPALA